MKQFAFRFLTMICASYTLCIIRSQPPHWVLPAAFFLACVLWEGVDSLYNKIFKPKN